MGSKVSSDKINHNIRVVGCKMGLDDENPVLPGSRCKQGGCDWRVNSDRDFNCVWFLLSRMEKENKTLTLREAGAMLSLNHERVRTIEERAKRKLLLVIEEMEEDPNDDEALCGSIVTERRTAASYNDSLMDKMRKAVTGELNVEEKSNDC